MVLSPVVFDLAKATVIFRPDGITEIRLKDGVQIEIEDSHEQTALLKKHKPPGGHLVLTETGKDTTVTPQVREYANSPEATSLSKAQAIIVYNLYQRIIVNFLVNVSRSKKHGMQIKLFTDRDKAVEWLKSFIKPNVAAEQ